MTEQLKYETHGHSNITDGFESPSQIARMAVGKVDIITLSDHNTVAGLPEFLDEVKEINDRGIPLVGIGATEVSTRLGHMTIACVDPSYSDMFINWASKQDLFMANPINLIRPAVDEVGATITFTHPEMNYPPGISTEDLMRVLDKLPGEYWNHIGLEVDNSAATFMAILYQFAQYRIDKANKQLGLTTVAGSDYHSARLIGRKFTLVPTFGGRLDLLRAFRGRTLTPSGRELTPGDIICTLGCHSYNFARFRLGLLRAEEIRIRDHSK